MANAVIENGILTNFIEGTIPGKLCVPYDGTAQVGDLWDGKVFSKPPTDTAQLKADGSAAIQKLLDTTAQAHGYDSILSLCSYATSANLKWQKEGQYGCNFRDACWNAAQQIQDAATAGNWPTAGAGQMPTVADVMKAMPAVAWPV